MTTNYGLNDTLKYYEFAFDSLDASTPKSGQYSKLDWPLFELGRPLQNVAALKILEFQCNFSYYVFNSLNNTFQITQIVYPSNVTTTVTIPPGNYTYTQMFGSPTGSPANTGVLALALDAATIAAGGTDTYTTPYNSSTQKVNIVNMEGHGFWLTFGSANDDGELNPRLWLGFNGGQIFADYSTGILVAPNVINLSGPNYLYINSQLIGPQVGMYLPAGTDSLGAGGMGPQVCKVPVNANPGAVIEWKDPAPLYYFDFENMTNFPFCDFFLSMGNTSQYPLQLNGGSFSFKMGILVNDKSHNDVVGTLMNQGGVVKRPRMN
jgi:hypothetical protein